MIQPIYLYGSEVLRRKAEDFDLNDKEGLATLVQDLKETLKVSDGCGLAAPQIGVSKRVLIVDGTGMARTLRYCRLFLSARYYTGRHRYGGRLSISRELYPYND